MIRKYYWNYFESIIEPNDTAKDNAHMLHTIIMLFFSEMPDMTEIPNTIYEI